MAPDEYIWPTLNHNPQLHAPGSYKGEFSDDGPERVTVDRLAISLHVLLVNISECTAMQFIDHMCIYGISPGNTAQVHYEGHRVKVEVT